MLKLFFQVAIFFISNSYSFSNSGNWIIQQSPTAKNLKECFFINSATGWIVGDSGIILKTTNSGSNWFIQQSGIFSDIGSVFFINDNSGWATSWIFKTDSVNYPGTVILKTTNGGDNWNRSMLPDTNNFYSNIYFLDPQKGFIGGVPDFIKYTTNGGASWINAISDSVLVNNLPMENISFLNAQTGYACGGTQDFLGIVWKTTNEGLNWKPSFLGVDAINDMYLFSEDTLFAAAGDFKFGASYFKSENSGSNWTNHNLGYVGKVTSIAFRTKYEGWMTIGYQQKFFLTTDRGNNWSILDPPNNSSIFDICFPDSLHGWAVGADGRILTYSIAVNVNASEITLNKSFELNQNYPNPFNPSTTINYIIPTTIKGQTANVRLLVYNNLGKEIVTLVDEKQNPGNYTVHFDGTNFPSGIYFYKLLAGDFSETKKMIVLK